MWWFVAIHEKHNVGFPPCILFGLNVLELAWPGCRIPIGLAAGSEVLGLSCSHFKLVGRALKNVSSFIQSILRGYTREPEAAEAVQRAFSVLGQLSQA